MDISTLSSTSTEAAKRPLGSTAKSSSPSTGDNRKRAERYCALSMAREWLGRRAFQIDPQANPGDIYRTHDCRWARRAPDVGVHFSAQYQSAHYSGLATCASVWACPVCAAKIQQRRRGELAQLVNWAYAQGHEPIMVTLTFPHCRFDSLADLLSKQREAFRIFRAGKAWQSFKQRHGFQGLVRSLELTHGRNGWHPHTHELWVVDPLDKRERNAFVEYVLERWAKACRKAGLLDGADARAERDFYAHSTDVRFQVKDSDYLAKQDSARAWGVDRELAASTSKKGKAKGVHPHEFLVRQAKGDFDLFLEYVNAMKGSRQLYWSTGLKAKVGVDELTDETLAEETREQADLLGLLTPEQWRVVRGNDARAELLDAAESGGWPACLALLASLGCELDSYQLNQLREVYGVLPCHFHQQADGFLLRHVPALPGCSFGSVDAERPPS